MTTEDYEIMISRLTDELEHVRQDRDSLMIVIAEACDRLTGRLDGGDVDALTDAVGQVNRLLEGEDLDVDLDEGSVATQVQRLIMWAHAGSCAYRSLLLPDARHFRAIVLSQALSDYLNTPLTVENLYRLTTLPFDGIDMDDEIRELLASFVDIFATLRGEDG